MTNNYWLYFLRTIVRERYYGSYDHFTEEETEAWKNHIFHDHKPSKSEMKVWGLVIQFPGAPWCSTSL